MARIPLTLYALADNNPLPGVVPAFIELKRINADDSVTDLIGSKPDFEDDGGGQYHAILDDAAILPGSTITWIIDATAAASSRYYDGELDASQPLIATIRAALQVGGDALLFSVGDLAPSLLFQLVDASGNARDLRTGSPTVVFSLRPSPTGSDYTIDHQPCSIVDAANGMVLFAWPSGSTDLEGLYLGQFVCTQAGLETAYPVGASLVARIVARV